MRARRLTAIALATGLVATGSALSGPAVARTMAKCDAPQPVCSAAQTVFAIASFDPNGSAVRIAPDLLITSRHLIADAKSADVAIAPGTTIKAVVVPTSYREDLVLLRAALPPGPVATIAAADASAKLFTIGAGLGSPRAITVYEPGRVLALPAQDHPSARLHHTAYTQRGNSGGAVIDAMGRLVGVAASGGEGRFEAIPASDIARLIELSGPAHAAANAEIGTAYRDCFAALETFHPSQIAAAPKNEMPQLVRSCAATNDRQMFDLAAQALGRVRIFKYAVDLYQRSVAMDPGALNARLGLAITLMFAQRPADAAAHINKLLDAIPDEPRVQRMAVQAGKQTSNQPMIDKALAAIAKHNPRGLDAAKRFLAARPPVPRQPAPGRLSPLRPPQQLPQSRPPAKE